VRRSLRKSQITEPRFLLRFRFVARSPSAILQAYSQPLWPQKQSSPLVIPLLQAINNSFMFDNSDDIETIAINI
jgi:hypothetical protein